MKKKAVYPYKKSLNLCIKEKSPFRPERLVPLLIAVFALAVLFGKFAVADRLIQASKMQTQASILTQRRNTLLAETAGYDELYDEYHRYSTGWMEDNEKLLVRRSEMLDLIESMLMPQSTVREINASGNTLSVTLGGVTLDDTSRFVQALYARDDVENVAVYTASTKDEYTDLAAVSMVITMTQDKGGDK